MPIIYKIMLKFFIFILFIFIAIRILVVFKDKIRFFATGFDKGFKITEISALWRLANVAELDEPEKIYYSLSLMNQAIIRFLSEIRENGTENLKQNQDFISKLYAYRTKISLDHENHKGLDSSKYLDKGQKLRILLHGNGVFQSEILDNTNHLVIKTPTRKGLIEVSSEDWVGKEISVYLWRKGDAAYVFDSLVESADIYLGNSALKVSHSNELLRTQKRKSIRVKCEIEAQLYFIDNNDVDYSLVETEPGFKCLLEDVSEDGALIRVGGKGVKDAGIKIQFEINGNLIVMFGTIRAVEYNKEHNQSRLHFECLHLDEPMKNIVLGFVYDLLPDDKKEVLDAISQTEEDKSEDLSNEITAKDNESDRNINEKFVESDSEDGIIEDLAENYAKEDIPVENPSDDEKNVGGFSAHFEDKVSEFKERMDAFNRS